MGDFNASDKSWEENSNGKGINLIRWADRYNGKIGHTTERTCNTVCGNRKPHLLLTRRIRCEKPSIQIESCLELRDHLPITTTVEAQAQHKKADKADHITGRRRCSPNVRVQAIMRWTKELPIITEQFQKCDTKEELERT